ncbi:MAG: MBL fold metallo-hydrolase [Trueperaceae bacterium]|nr:MBL fold metallo-hydrolase [Trueperaceae bacterium]
MKLYTLGTGAPLHYTRATTGFLVEAAGEPLLIDTCGGFELVRRLKALGKTPEGFHHAVLTHRHGDHIGGVMALAIAANPLHLYGSADALQATKDLLTLTYGEAAFNVLEHVQFHPVEAGRAYDIAGYTLEFLEVVHRVPTLAVRLEHAGKVIAFSADTLPCDNAIEVAKHADLYLCDALCARADGASYIPRVKDLQHPIAAEAAQMAKEAGAKALALTHIARYGTAENMLKEAGDIFSGELSVPDDLHCFEL